ncbi:MAG: hypothetical protein SPL62_03365 [Selenomonas sp.]|uniref:hypothetical protein n=1 Tax=uncultured Selenomonas sp. TaxID=159275 RepID=UPI0025EA0C49|nr:hypothetical protein [uncultured Selenomonas sp.]MDY6349523.1 hypothetical protein [Selenomonas sp.]
MAMGTGRIPRLPMIVNLLTHSFELKLKYGFQMGYFGQRGQSGNSKIRNIPSSDPDKTAKDFFFTLTQGVEVTALLRKSDGAEIGLKARFVDGTTVSYRPRSSSDGTPAVQISFAFKLEIDIKAQKIHFTNGD